MSKVSRIFPEAKTGVIHWMEQNFHEIDQFVMSFKMKDNTTMTVYDCYSFLEAMGLLGVAQATVSDLANSESFIQKERRNET